MTCTLLTDINITYRYAGNCWVQFLSINKITKEKGYRPSSQSYSTTMMGSPAGIENSHGHHSKSSCTMEKSLPASDSPDLELVPATPSERIETLKLNISAFGGRLDIQSYIERENHLHQQQLNRNGLITWILVNRNEAENDRTILSSCETYPKRALVAHDGRVETAQAQAVGSVFCPLMFRRKGYAGRMIAELSGKVETWQTQQAVSNYNVGRSHCLFSVLYSDIGKSYYARFGWVPFPSSHISLPPLASKSHESTQQQDDNPSVVRLLSANDVRESMCNEHVAEKERNALQKDSEKSPKKAIVAIVPDFDHYEWHWAREEFYAQRLGRFPSIKGAGVDQEHADHGVYCTWNRSFGDTPEHNTLFILHWVYNEPISPSDEKSTINAISAILQRARREAHEWNMSTVELWNPSPLIRKAAALIDPIAAQLVHREESSICSLKWHGFDEGLGNDVEWRWNEKYAWC